MLIFNNNVIMRVRAKFVRRQSRLRLENMEDYKGSWYYDCCKYSYWQPPLHQYSQLSPSGSDEYRDGAQSHSTV